MKRVSIHHITVVPTYPVSKDSAESDKLLLCLVSLHLSTNRPASGQVQSPQAKGPLRTQYRHRRATHGQQRTAFDLGGMQAAPKEQPAA